MMSEAFLTRCKFVLLQWPLVFLVWVRLIFVLMLDGKLMESSTAYLVHCFVLLSLLSDFFSFLR